MSTVIKYAPQTKIPRDLATVGELPKFISENQIKLFSKEEYSKYDIVNYHLEQKKTDDAFYIVDLGEILEQFKQWKTHLPRIEPFYAVKCCPNEMILKTLAVLGCSFDCASKAEIIRVTDLDVPANRIIYANPVKDPQFRLYPRINYLSENVNKALADALAGRHNEPEVKLGSLMRYYSVLPDFVRTNPLIINLVRAFEFTKHDMSLEQKEMALNYAAQFCLPMDPVLEDAVKEAVISTKYIIPMWEEVQLLNEDADAEKSEGYVPGQKKKKGVALLQIGDEILNADRSELKPADADQMAQWPSPPRLDPYVPEEDPFPVLPLDYYQNEDGFWNDYIAWKESKYDELPMMMTRRSFKH